MNNPRRVHSFAFLTIAIVFVTVIRADPNATTQQSHGTQPSTKAAATTRPVHPAGDEIDVQEMMFRHMIGPSDAANDFCFLGVSISNDPNPELMARLKDVKRKIFPASESAGDAGGIRHKELGGSGIVLRVVSVNWIDDNSAEVLTRTYRNGLNSSIWRYRVERKEKKWVITEQRLMGQS